MGEQECTFEIVEKCVIIESEAYMYLVGIVLAGLFLRQMMLKKNETAATGPDYTDVDKWIKETDDAFGGTAAGTDVDPLGHQPELTGSGTITPKKSGGIEELDADSKPELTEIECPDCGSVIGVRKLNKMQDVKCNVCGLEGEIEA